MRLNHKWNRELFIGPEKREFVTELFGKHVKNLNPGIHLLIFIC